MMILITSSPPKESSLLYSVGHYPTQLLTIFFWPPPVRGMTWAL